MATAAVALPHPKSPAAGHGQSPGTPSIKPPSPSSAPPAMFAPPQQTLPPVYGRRDSGESVKDDHPRSQSTPTTRPVSPPPKRTHSSGNLPPFLTTNAILSPPSFHPANHRTSSPESRRTRSSENLLGGSSPESSPHQGHASLGGSSYLNGQQHVAMRPSDHQLYSNQDYDAMMRPKKRHKTSRACDECRRKKIRCDATSEANVEQCSSCKRAGVNCSFSRVPMKRGPTKGLEAQYIRELEDRLVSLEYSVQTKGSGRESSPPVRRVGYNAEGGTPPQMYAKTQQLQNEPVKLNPLGSHSRNHMDRLPPIDAIHGSPPLSAERRQSTSDYFRQPLPYQPQPRHDPLPPHQYHQNQHDRTPSDRRSTTEPSRKLSFSAHPHDRSSSFNESIIRRPSAVNVIDKSPVPLNAELPLDEAAIHRYAPLVSPPNFSYYDTYHPIFPVLPHSMGKLHGYLAAAPLYLRNSLLHAIYALTAVDPRPATPTSPRSPPPTPAHIDHTLKSCDGISAAALNADESNQMSLSRNLLHMQILILLALNADKRAFAAPQEFEPGVTGATNQQTYTPRFVASVFGAAWGCANELRLHENSSAMIRKRTHEQMESPTELIDPDGEDNLARRAWWILVMLDRWRAVSTSSMPLISDDKIYLKDSDRQVLGESTYHLVRLSCVLGHIGEVPNSNVSPDVSLNLGQIARLLNGEVDRVRETAERVINQNAILGAAFWHTKLLIVSHTSETFQSHGNVYHALLSAAKRVVDHLQLSRIINSNSPVVHHIVGFLTVVLVRLSSVSDTRDEAHKLLLDLVADRKQSQFDPDRAGLLVEGYEIIVKKFIDHSNGRRHNDLAYRRESDAQYNDSNGIGGLAHLAELADREYSERQYHQVKSEAWRNIGGEEGLDTMVKRQGYLYALQTLLQSR